MNKGKVKQQRRLLEPRSPVSDRSDFFGEPGNGLLMLKESFLDVFVLWKMQQLSECSPRD